MRDLAQCLSCVGVSAVPLARRFVTRPGIEVVFIIVNRKHVDNSFITSGDVYECLTGTRPSFNRVQPSYLKVNSALLGTSKGWRGTSIIPSSLLIEAYPEPSCRQFLESIGRSSISP